MRGQRKGYEMVSSNSMRRSASVEGVQLTCDTIDPLEGRPKSMAGHGVKDGVPNQPVRRNGAKQRRYDEEKNSSRCSDDAKISSAVRCDHLSDCSFLRPGKACEAWR